MLQNETNIPENTLALLVYGCSQFMSLHNHYVWSQISLLLLVFIILLHGTRLSPFICLLPYSAADFCCTRRTSSNVATVTANDMSLSHSL